MYMGTPEFAVPALDVLHGSNLGSVFVVTRPDRPRGRGHRLAPSPVKTRAGELGLPVFEPESLRIGEEWKTILAQTRPDLIVVCAYGKILPKGTLETPRFGCINIHASLLPKYRGAAPIHRAVESGDGRSGVSLMYMSEGMDEGDVIASRAVSIEGMSSGEVTEVLAKLGADMLSDELPAVMNGAARREPQDDAEATYAPPVRREEGRIDFSRTPFEIERKVLAMTPSPGAYAFLGGEKIKLWEVRASECAAHALSKRGVARPGEVVRTDGGVIEVAAGLSGAVEIMKIQSPGGKPMAAADWLRGHSVERGAMFE
jgi:methionyl-tRNA formyltransferase